MKPFLLTLTLFTAALAAHAQSWTNNYNGPGNGDDSGNAIAVDRNGNVFVTGGSTGSGGAFGYATIKYSNAGDPLWTNWSENSGGAAIAVGSNGIVVVTGSDGHIGNADYITIAYSNAGAPLWTNRYNGPGNDGDSASAIVVGVNGNVFVTGTFWNSDINGALVNPAFATVAYSSIGLPLWTNLYIGPGNGNAAVGLAVDGEGNVVVTGSSDSGIGQDWVTIKYSSVGVPLWTNRYSGLVSTDNDYAAGVAVDGDGNVFVTGSADFPADYATIKYSSAGLPLWTNRYNGPSVGDNLSFDIATAIAVDGSGNVLVTGYSTEGGFANPDYLTIKYSNAGLPLWTNRYNGPGYESDVPLAMAVNGAGRVFVTGRSSGSAGYDDYATLAYSSEGAPLWTNRYSGPGNFFDEAHAIAVDGSGNVFVTGKSWNGTNDDYVTIRYAAEVAPPSLNIQRLGNSVVLSWTNAAFGLQSAPTVTSTFTNIVGATSPYTNLISNGQQFFRLVQ